MRRYVMVRLIPTTSPHVRPLVQRHGVSYTTASYGPPFVASDDVAIREHVAHSCLSHDHIEDHSECTMSGDAHNTHLHSPAISLYTMDTDTGEVREWTSYVTVNTYGAKTIEVIR